MYAQDIRFYYKKYHARSKYTSAEIKKKYCYAANGGSAGRAVIRLRFTRKTGLRRRHNIWIFL